MTLNTTCFKWRFSAVIFLLRCPLLRAFLFKENDRKREMTVKQTPALFYLDWCVSFDSEFQEEKISNSDNFLPTNQTMRIVTSVIKRL